MSTSQETIIVTGAAGFIGFHTAQKLLELGHQVVGIDSLNDYYDVSLKNARLAELQNAREFRFERLDLSDEKKTLALFNAVAPDRVVHLAAQPGVRYSLINPQAYSQSNVAGFINVLEGCRATNPKHFVYASSSSVYGANSKIPYAVGDRVDQPMSLYAATKRSNEMMAQSYSHLFGIPATGLRFFTVYGPWGRPDMAVYSFTRDILEGRAIKVFNNGNLRRDFTYVDDIVDGVLRCLAKPPQSSDEIPERSRIPAPPHKIYNIGNNQPVELMHMIDTIEQLLGREAVKEYLPMQPGDVFETYADITPIQQEMGFSPSTSIEQGLDKFVQWYRSYHG